MSPRTPRNSPNRPGRPSSPELDMLAELTGINRDRAGKYGIKRMRKIWAYRSQPPKPTPPPKPQPAKTNKASIARKRVLAAIPKPEQKRMMAWARSFQKRYNAEYTCGTRRNYYRGCRCQECKSAESAYRRSLSGASPRCKKGPVPVQNKPGAGRVARMLGLAEKRRWA